MIEDIMKEIVVQLKRIAEAVEGVTGGTVEPKVVTPGPAKFEEPIPVPTTPGPALDSCPTGPVTVPGKRGRKSNAEKAAAEAASTGRLPFQSDTEAATPVPEVMDSNEPDPFDDTMAPAAGSTKEVTKEDVAGVMKRLIARVGSPEKARELFNQWGGKDKIATTSPDVFPYIVEMAERMING